MLAERIYVDLVRYSYTAAFRDHYKTKWAPVGKVNPSTKLHTNCLSFYTLSVKTGEPLYILMLAAFLLYPGDWCLRTFKRTYLPFNVITGERVRNRLYKECIQSAGKNDATVEVETVLKLLKTFDKDIVVDLIKEGVIVGKGTSAQTLALEIIGRREHPVV